MIFGERIRFRSPEREDTPHYIEWLNDPEVRQGLARNMPASVPKQELWFDAMLDRPIYLQPLIIEVLEKQKWIIIGTWRFHQIDWTSRSAEIGIVIGNKSYWGKGFGTETLKLIQKVGFEIHNLNRIALQVKDFNKGAIKAYEKAGFIHEGVMRQAAFQHGEYIDMVYMAILRSEWETQV